MRARTSGENFFDSFVAPSSQELEPPQNTGRFIFGQVTGGVGREGTKLYHSLESIVTGDTVPASRVPIVGMFYGKTNSDQGVRAKYYSIVRDINIVDRKLKGLAENGGDLDAWLAEKPEATLAKAADDIGRKVSTLNKYRSTLPNSARDEKRAIEQEVMALHSLLIDLHK